MQQKLKHNSNCKMKTKKEYSKQVPSFLGHWMLHVTRKKEKLFSYHVLICIINSTWLNKCTFVFWTTNFFLTLFENILQKFQLLGSVKFSSIFHHDWTSNCTSFGFLPIVNQPQIFMGKQFLLSECVWNRLSWI